MKLEVALIAIACFALPIFADDNILGEPDQLINEKECAYQGGICSFVQECPEGSLTAVKGLCPQQQYMGVECCYGIPLSRKSCKARGGECRAAEDCGSAPRAAAECPNDEEVCCVLIN